MNVLGNSLDNNALTAMTRQAAPRVVNAIKTAAHRTGVNFAYLMEQAAAESSFDAKAGSKSSSAKGLYQFIESTWLKMVKSHGAEHGLGKYAALIDDNGKVTDPQARREILELRNNPEKASLLAAEFASENQRYLVQHSGLAPNEIGSTELYLAHFLGAGGAAAFLKAHKNNPLANAADLFPKAANANRNVFYDAKTGAGRTLAGVYDFFAKKFQSSGQASPMVAAEIAPRTPALTSSLRTVLVQDMAARRPVYDFLSHPALPSLAPELDFGWSRSFTRSSFGTGVSPLSPAQIMLLAALDGPEKADKE